MPAQKKKRKSIFDTFKAAETHVKKRSLSWYDKLSKEDKEWCISIKNECNSGKYGHISMGALAQEVRNELGIKITDNTFRVWVRSQCNSK